MYYPGEIENNSYAISMGLGALKKTYCAHCENWRPIETRFQQFQLCFLRKKGEKKKDLNALH